MRQAKLVCIYDINEDIGNRFFDYCFVGGQLFGGSCPWGKLFGGKYLGSNCPGGNFMSGNCPRDSYLGGIVIEPKNGVIVNGKVRYIF